MQSTYKRSFLIVSITAFALLATIVLSYIAGAVSAKYAKEVVYSDIAVIPKNYYTVTYFQHDGSEFQKVNVYSNTSHTLRDGTGVNLPSGAESFAGWVNALGEAPDLTKRGDYSLYPTFTYPEATYEVRFMDMQGETLIGTATFKEGQAGKNGGSIITPPTAPTVEDMDFQGWVVRSGSDTVAWSDYTLTKADVVVYAQYVYNGNLELTGVDAEPKDGIIDYYQVESVDDLGETVTVPGYINGVPVAIVSKLTSNLFDDTTTIILEEGIQVLKQESLAGTPDLNTVVLPSTLTTIENKTFSSNVLGMASKDISFTYNGTGAQWDAIDKQSGWDAGLADGVIITCSDGVYRLSRSWLGTYTWTWTPN